MNLRRAFIAFSFLLLAAGRLLAAEVWFTSAPSPVESGQGYYVEAYTYSYYENGIDISLYKNGGWFASSGGWSDASAGAWTSDAGPQTVNFMAEANDPYDGSSWAWASVTVNGTPPPVNNPPSAWVEVDGFGPTATVTRPYGGTVNITVRYKAGDADGNLARIRPQVWHPATGLFTNDGGAWTGQGGGYGEVVRTLTLDRDGDWYFWTDAEDTNNVFVNSGAWGDAFRLNVVQGAPPDTTPPDRPQNLVVSGLASTSFTLSWSAPSGEAAIGYRVRLDSGSFLEIGNVLSRAFSGLAAGSSHTVEVQARDAAGNWSAAAGMGVTTSSGGGGGGTANAQSIWTQVPLPNGYNDGILDEIIKAGTADFYYQIESWYTENTSYAFYPADEYWYGLGISHLNQNYGDFTFVWLPSIRFWEGGYDTWFSLVFHLEALANADYWIYRDRTGSTTLNPANFEIVGSANFPTTAPQEVIVQINNPGAELDGVAFYLVKQGLPVGSLQLSDTTGTVLVNNVPVNGTANLVIPASGQVVLGVIDTAGRAINAAHNVAWKILDTVGNVLRQGTSLNVDLNGLNITQIARLAILMDGAAERSANLNIQPLTFPAGTDTATFTMPAINDNGQVIPKSTVTIGVMPDLRVGAIAGGNRWFAAPEWLNGYMTDPNWMAENDSLEDTPDQLIFGFLQAGPALPHVIRGVTVLIQNPAAVAAAAEAATLTVVDASLLVTVYMAYYAQEVLFQRKPDLVMSYVTYEKIHPVNHKVYAGRTAGKGTPLVVLARRDADHAIKRPDYLPAVLHSSTTWNGISFRGYAGMRGREQQVIDFHRDRSVSTDVFEFSGNAINGVSPSNADALRYWKTSNADFGNLTDYRAFASTGEVVSQDRVPLASPFSRAPLINP